MKSTLDPLTILDADIGNTFLSNKLEDLYFGWSILCEGHSVAQ